jgi:protein-L-isoaspartate(D-aspartate) O-methyltransferase
VINSYWGDGYEGKESYAPFNKILITAAIPQIPEKLLSQLAVGGRLVAPVGKGNTQTMTVIKKLSENNYETSYYADLFKFVPMCRGISEI